MENKSTRLQLTSSAFTEGKPIPKVYSMDGGNKFPPFKIEGVPPAARSLAIFMEDLDSPIGPFTHWLVWNLPPTTQMVAENSLPAGSETGINGFGTLGYGGPCPPSGRHRYCFRLFAIDSVIDATEGDRRYQIEDEMEGSILAEATLTGTFETTN